MPITEAVPVALPQFFLALVECEVDERAAGNCAPTPPFMEKVDQLGGGRTACFVPWIPEGLSQGYRLPHCT